jgi:hypothetical protein
MKHAPNIITRGKYAYEMAGHFKSKVDAELYKNQTLHSLLVVADEPNIYGVGVKYHVYRRLN